MRRSSTAAAASLVALAVAGFAYAANMYTVDGGTSPRGKGTAGKPLPVSLSFGYTVRDQSPDVRGTPVEKYLIGTEGLVTYPEEFPTCSGGSDGANNQDLDRVKRLCREARVGGGIVKAYAGDREDPTQKLNCVLELNLYNVEPGDYEDRGRISKKDGGLAIRVDGAKPMPPSLDDEYKGRCAALHGEAILAPYRPVRIEGVRSDQLRFAVPQSLLHPGGLEMVVQELEAAVRKRVSAKEIGGRNREVGFYSAVRCKGSRRSIQVTFISESGERTPVTNDAPC